MTMVAGFAAAVFDVNSHGKQTDVRYFGPDGKLGTRDMNGVTRVVIRYDARDNMIDWASFGANGKPLPGPAGFAEFRAVFDARSNEIERTFFGPDGRPVALWDGYSAIRRVYDFRGKKVEEAYFGVDGEAVVNRDGYAKLSLAYDPRGNVIATTFLGIDGSPVLDKDGAAKIVHSYDARGNEIERAFFGLDNRPRSTKDGYAMVKYDYDDFGRETRANYLDAAGRGISMEMVVVNVLRGATAERIGIKTGDRILSYDGKVPTSTRQFIDLVTNATGAASRALVVRRGSEILKFEIAAGRLGITLEMMRAASEAAATPQAQAN